MDGQVGHAVVPGGEAAAGAAGKPEHGAAAETKGLLGGAEGAFARHDEEENVQVST